MKKIILATTLFFLMLGVGYAQDNNIQLQKVTGTFYKAIKANVPYYIELDGSVGIGNIKKGLD
ncbi:MAG: hypothetical protein ABIG64_02645 [Candidatus Omnitrophota bacterium]